MPVCTNKPNFMIVHDTLPTGGKETIQKEGL